MRRWVVSLSFVVFAACEPTIPEGRFACDVTSDCPPDMVCRTNVHRCFLTLADGGSVDAGSDAGSRDAGADPRDAGQDASTDAGP